MKKISINLFKACDYLKTHGNESLTEIAKKFKTDRHSLSKHKDDYLYYKYFYQDNYYLFSEQELLPVNYFLEHSEIPLEVVAKKFKTKGETIKRKMTILGEEYERRYKRKFHRDIFKIIDSPEKAYWIGFFLADGYLNEEKSFLTVKLGIKDKEHLAKLAIFMGDHPQNIKEDVGGAYTRDNKCVYISFSSKELTQDLIKCNIRQGKSGKERPYKDLNEEYKKDYIRGLIDGDGHVEDGYFKYIGSLESCQYIKDYFSQWYDFKENCSYIYQQGSVYTFQVRSKQVNNILKIIYKDALIYLDRKYAIVQKL